MTPGGGLKDYRKFCLSHFDKFHIANHELAIFSQGYTQPISKCITISFGTEYIEIVLLALGLWPGSCNITDLFNSISTYSFD